MFRFGSQAAITDPQFLPPADGRSFVDELFGALRARLGEVTTRPRVFERPSQKISDPDRLFDALCAVQDELGWEDVDFTLAASPPPGQSLGGLEAIGDPNGHLLHTMRSHAPNTSDFVLVFSPAIFKVPEIALASVARESGRLAMTRVGLDHDEALLADPERFEGAVEISAVLLGLGPWLANGSYLFQNACCGGGCGVDLRSVRAALSLPEACYATALDAQARGLARRRVLKQLDPTQKAALKASWSELNRSPVAALQAAPESQGVQAIGTRTSE